jgi:hypothetical protein
MAQRGTCNDGRGRRTVKVVDKKVVDKPYTVLLVHLSTYLGFLVQYI